METLTILGPDSGGQTKEAQSLSRLGGPAGVRKAAGAQPDEEAGRRLLKAMDAYDPGVEGTT